MTGKYFICVLAAFFCIAIASTAIAREPVLHDGFVLAGVDGKLITADDKSFFEPDSDVSDDNTVLKAGTRLELLPSSALDKINDTPESYRLWAAVIRYKDENFLFATYFLAVGEVKVEPAESPAPVEPKQPQPQETPPRQVRLSINEPNDPLAIPEQILSKLKSRKLIRPQQPKTIPNSISHAKKPGKALGIVADRIFANQVGFIKDQGDGRLVFILDRLGRNIEPVSLSLLPSQTLEKVELKQSTQPEPLRFKVAGIATKYKGQEYLLLQRAARVYKYGNFDSF